MGNGMNERTKELAEQCGYRSNPDIYDRNQSFDIEKFAELVRADEREACAKLCDEWLNGKDYVYNIAKAIRARRSEGMSIHTCSYYCERPECIKAQRDELRQAIEQAEQIVPSDYPNHQPVAWMCEANDWGTWKPSLFWVKSEDKFFRNWVPLYTASLTCRENLQVADCEMICNLKSSAPPECKTEAEKIAYAFGWWQAWEQMNKSYGHLYGQVMDNEDTICKTHPDAPHGFNRNASLTEGRYVCDCEYWEPSDDGIDMSEECVHILDKHEHNELKNALELQPFVKEFFNKYLNYVEESESGRLFNPITIGCCRAMMHKPLDELLEKMRVLSGANPNPLYEDEDNGR